MRHLKEHPILMSAASVRAVLRREKTQTRRVVTDATSQGNFRASELLLDGHPVFVDGGPSPAGNPGHYLHAPLNCEVVEKRRGWKPGSCDPSVVERLYPRWFPGDRLWVRETWADVNSEEGPALAYRADQAVRSWHDFSETFGPDFGAGPSMDYDAYPGEYCMWWSDLFRGEPGHGWRSPIHMPRWACRIVLAVTAVRCERLQEITQQDARAEGAIFWFQAADGRREIGPHQIEYAGRNVPEDKRDYVRGFRESWDALNAKRGYSWESNPFVWVIEFERAPDLTCDT